jgi:hypothetical protein
MNRFWAAVLALALAATARADYSYKQTSQVTGGAFLKFLKVMPGGGKATEPIVTKMSIKGNRMVTEDKDGYQIIDLDKETMTDVNLKEKAYSVITFAEMKAAMEAMLKKMSEGKSESAASADVEMKMDVKETGQSKEVSGVSTKEFLLLMGWTVTDKKSGQKADMNIDNQMWMAEDLPGYDEVRNFHMRMAEKIQWAPGMATNAMAAMQPNVREGMQKLIKEAQKLKGVPVQQVMKMKMAGQNGEVPDLPEFQFPGMRETMESELQRTAANEAAYQTARSAGGRFGGLAGAAAGGALGGMMRGMGKKKKAEEPPPAEEAKPAAKKGDGTYMEVTTTTSDWSTASVDLARFDVPSGFKQIEHPMKKASK